MSERAQSVGREGVMVEEDNANQPLASRELGEINHRLVYITRGPWTVAGATLVAHFGDDGATVAVVGEPRATQSISYTPLKLGSPFFDEACANAEFIAHARTDIPRLLATVRKLQTQLAEYGQQESQE